MLMMQMGIPCFCSYLRNRAPINQFQQRLLQAFILRSKGRDTRYVNGYADTDILKKVGCRYVWGFVKYFIHMDNGT